MEVGLYIYKDFDWTYDNTTQVVNSFESRVIADGGTFEAETCCIDIVESLGGTFTTETIARAYRMDIFDDEKISVTSSIQNINDISKVFTDYSQSFTIPASKVNNSIFKHWYENKVDNGFNQLVRYNGYITLNGEVFRVGKWQIESASVKGNKILDYKITFYGNLKSMLDQFGEDKLRDLTTLNEYTVTYSGNTVQTRIVTNNAENVLYPLVSSQRVWQYGGGGANDISSNTTPIVYTELAPALKLARVFDAIESKYGISFNGNFLTQSRFTDAYLWLKNKEVFTPTSSPTTIDLNTVYIDNGGLVTFNTANNTYEVFNDEQAGNNTLYLDITLNVSTTWKVTVFKNGVNFTNMTGTGSAFQINLPQDNANYSLTIQTGTSASYTGFVYGSYQIWDFTTQWQWVTYDSACTVSGTTNSQLDLTQYVPDIKVADFVSGVLKMFNLTAFSYDENTYTLEQLENWYYQGNIKDYSQYCVTDFEYERIKPYKKINFEYEKCESLLNRAFYDNNAREYGNLDYPFNTDGADYNIKLPFENILFNKFTGTNLQVAYSINKDLQPYIPKPIIIYRLGTASCDFYFNNGTSTDNITTYNVFGQDATYQGQTHSLNWGIEISSYYLNSINNSLFNDYYLAYLSNLYSLKSRMVKVTMRLPYTEMLSLRLNDRIVIRDKRYIINQYTTDFDTFETKMELIQDFRSILFNNGLAQTIDNTAQTLRFNTTSTEPLTWTIQQDLNGQIINIIDGDSYVEVETKANTTGTELYYSIESNLGDVIVITQTP